MCKTAVCNSSWNLESMIFITDTVLVTSDPNSCLYCPFQTVFLLPGSGIRELKPQKNFMHALDDT